MVSMQKEEMIRYLKDYSIVQDMAAHNPNIRLWDIFTNYMIQTNRLKDANRQYYDRMRNTYCTYCLLKIYSFSEDFLLNRDNYLNNDDISNIKNEISSKYDTSNISNKQIVQLIRNAFNHNDDPSFDRFKMSVNGKNIEISFKDIRTEKEIKQGVSEKPVQIKIKAKNLAKIKNIITENKQNLLFLSYDIPENFNVLSENLDKELDKIKILHYYFDRKLTNEEVNKIAELTDIKNILDPDKPHKLDDIHKFSQSIGRYEKFDLNQDQKDQLIEFINRYKEIFKVYLEKQDTNVVMYYFINKILPIPMTKNLELENQIINAGIYQHDSSFSHNEIRKRVYRAYLDQEIPEYYDEEDKYVHNKLREMGTIQIEKLYRDMLSIEFIQLFPAVMYIDSVVTHYCDDKEITIDDITYDKEKIRNSFAHGRWFISKNSSLVMYDADPRNINDYNLEEVGKINIGSFFDWAEKYTYNKELNKRQQHKKIKR